MKSAITFDWLIHPQCPDDFFSNYWEKKHLHIQRANANYYSFLLSLSEIDHIISTYDIRFPSLRLANSKSKIDSSEFVISREIHPGQFTSEEGFINIQKVYELYANGNTIILNHLERNSWNLANLGRAIEAVFNMPFQSNIYLTPPLAQGFRAHYDTHDVFILQISGKKKWRLYGRPLLNPLREQDYGEITGELGDPEFEFFVEAGDILYIPRGLVHEAITSDVESLHITFGAISYKWSDFLLDVIAKTALKDSELRNALPVGFCNESFDSEKMMSEYNSLLLRLANKDSFESSLAFFRQKFFTTRKPLLRGQLKNISDLKLLKQSTVISKRLNLYILKECTVDGIKLSINGIQNYFPMNLVGVVNFICENEVFALQDIPGEIDFELKQTIIMQLIRVGMLTIHS